MLATGVFVAASQCRVHMDPRSTTPCTARCRTTNRPGALSRISTGTSLGIAAAAIAAFAVSQSDLSWRISWAIFAVAGGLALIVNRAALRQVEKAPDPARHPDPWQRVLRTPALALLVVAFVLGTTSAIYISFAADQMTRAGGVPGIARADTAALVFPRLRALRACGAFEPVRCDGPWALRSCCGPCCWPGPASAALVALMPGSWAGVILSAGLQGVFVMMASAVMAFWSERLYPAMPSFRLHGDAACHGDRQRHRPGDGGRRGRCPRGGTGLPCKCRAGARHGRPSAPRPSGRTAGGDLAQPSGSDALTASKPETTSRSSRGYRLLPLPADRRRSDPRGAPRCCARHSASRPAAVACSLASASAKARYSTTNSR